MMTEPTEQPDLIARIERALVLLAYFIELDGDVHVPLYEKFEAELAELRARENAKARAGERLAAYRRSNARNAITFDHCPPPSIDGTSELSGL